MEKMGRKYVGRKWKSMSFAGNQCSNKCSKTILIYFHTSNIEFTLYLRVGPIRNSKTAAATEEDICHTLIQSIKYEYWSFHFHHNKSRAWMQHNANNNQRTIILAAKEIINTKANIAKCTQTAAAEEAWTANTYLDEGRLKCISHGIIWCDVIPLCNKRRGKLHFWFEVFNWSQQMSSEPEANRNISLTEQSWGDIHNIYRQDSFRKATWTAAV